MQKKEIPYSVPDTKWEEKRGNHRAIITIENTQNNYLGVYVEIPWRRRDRRLKMKRIIIIDAESGKKIKHIYRVSMNREVGTLVFKPNQLSKLYYIYYMPFFVDNNHGYYAKGYYPREWNTSLLWRFKVKKELLRLKKSKVLIKGTVHEIQSRTNFDSFYPMEIPLLKDELKAFKGQMVRNFTIFPEDRQFPIRMFDELPLKWYNEGIKSKFQGSALRNEYYIFQLGVYANKNSLKNVILEYSSLKLEKSSEFIAAESFTCFNIDGVDPKGNDFKKIINVKEGQIQPLWIGIDIPKSTSAGTYSGVIKIIVENDVGQEINLSIDIQDKISEDRGDSETWKHSRLRWLNSRIALDHNIVAPFIPLKKEDNQINSLMHSVKLNHFGLPENIESTQLNILKRPINFNISTDSQSDEINEGENIYNSIEDGFISWSNLSETKDYSLKLNAFMEFDGYIEFAMNIEAKNGFSANNIELEIPVDKKLGAYFMGIQKKGGFISNHIWNWKGPSNSFWVGNHQVGLHCKLLGASYTGPMLNLYHPKPAPTWYNKGRGKVSVICDNANENVINISVGPRSFKPKESVEFKFAILCTPIKKLDTSQHFQARYFHHIEPKEKDFEAGINTINVHHANKYNPYINYPFVAVDEMKGFVNKMHDKGMKVKIYYTVRELSNYLTEIWAIRSLGDEILPAGKIKMLNRLTSSGYPWLREHLRENYVPQWYAPLENETKDAALLNSGESRWYNYYLEGLAWLLKNVDIDGLYLDDVSFDRNILKRIRKIMESIKPGVCQIDLHSNTGFSKGPAVKYTGFFPYINKTWFGESFKYNRMSFDQWFVETASIPFGLMGDMLQDGGNRWLGMVFGMTARAPWESDKIKAKPYPVWKIWDEFRIHEAEMFGFWNEDTPIQTSNANVKATIYLKPNEALIAVGNWSSSSESVHLEINWKNIGFIKEDYMLFAPDIKDFQSATTFEIDQMISVPAKKGWLLYLKKK
jgi:Glycoside hydrolase 123, N-terminal domain